LARLQRRIAVAVGAALQQCSTLRLERLQLDALEIVFFTRHIARATQADLKYGAEWIVFLPILQQVNRVVVTSRLLQQVGKLHAFSQHRGRFLERSAPGDDVRILLATLHAGGFRSIVRKAAGGQ
jgi:hypothetical protein